MCSRFKWNSGFHSCVDYYLFSVFSYQERKLEDLLNQRKQVCNRSPIILTIAGDKRSPQSLSPGCYYACVTLCSQHLFGLPLRMNGMHRTQFGHAHLDLLPLVIWSCMVWTICHMKLRQSAALEQKRLDLRSLSPALPNLWLSLVIIF